MSGARYTGGSRGIENDRVFSKRSIIKYAVLIFTVCALSVAQTSFVKVNGMPIGIVLLFVSATGMLFGERDGGIIGLIGGLIVDCLGGGIIYIAPLIYAVIGYFCGICVSRFLQRNLPSYIVYMIIVGIIKQAVNLLYFVMLSDNLNLMQIFVSILVPDYLAYVLLSQIFYGITYILYKILSLKKNKKY